MPKSKDELIPYLHKYFMTASLMAQEFDRHSRAPERYATKDVAEEMMMFPDNVGTIGRTLVFYGQRFFRPRLRKSCERPVCPHVSPVPTFPPDSNVRSPPHSAQADQEAPGIPSLADQH